MMKKKQEHLPNGSNFGTRLLYCCIAFTTSFRVVSGFLYWKQNKRISESTKEQWLLHAARL